MALYRLMLADEKHVHLPEPLLDLTTKRLLTMTWIEGEPLMTFLDEEAVDRAAQQGRLQHVPRLVRAVL